MSREDLLAKKVEVLRLPEKMRLVGGQQVDRDLQLGRLRAALQQIEILAVTLQPVVAQAR